MSVWFRVIRLVAFRQFSPLLVVVFILCNFSSASSEISNATQVNHDDSSQTGSQSGNIPQPAYSSGEIIIKYKSTLTESAQNLIEYDRPFAAALVDKSTYLDQVNNQIRVTAARGLFFNRRSIRTNDARKNWLEEIVLAKNRYPSRTQRFPMSASLDSELYNAFVITYAENIRPEAACALYERDRNVAYCQPNYIFNASLFPNDQYFNSSNSWGQPYDDLWALKPNRLNMSAAWDISAGAGIVIGVVDTGVDYTHPDISSNLWINPGEDLNSNGQVDPSDLNQLDDDGNGYIDDIRGWDFTTCVEFTSAGCGQIKLADNDPFDDHGHGTHVSGIIAADGQNGVGIIGVAFRSKIMPLKGLGVNGGSSSDLAEALIYAAMNGADVVNNSWGHSFRNLRNPIVEDAVRLAHNLGLVIVFAAGNARDDAIYYSPQNMTNPKPIVVASSTYNDWISSFSNRGLLIDVAAPGSGTTPPNNPPIISPERGILSLRSVGTVSTMDQNGELIVGDDYLRQAGTSMAAPYVSGVAALILAKSPTITNDDVRQLLRSSADDLGIPGHDMLSGAGRLDAQRALSEQAPLHVKLIEPAFGSSLSQLEGEINIVGDAFGPEFQSYQLFIANPVEGSAPLAWTEMGPAVTSAVGHGLLGIWQTASLPNGLYLIKLVATTASGKQFLDMAYVSLEANLSNAITTDSANQDYPDVSGNLVVWSDNRNGNYDIYLRDLRNGVERSISTRPGIEVRPSISGRNIVWEESSDGNYDIYFCTFSESSGACPEERITYSAANRSPTISGNRIVWYNEVDGKPYLCDYSPATHSCPQIQLSINARVHTGPDVSGDRVVWKDYRHGMPETYLCNYNSEFGTCQEQRITNNQLLKWSPRIFGERIVWEEYHHLEGASDIFLYETGSNSTRRLTSHWGNQIQPRISGDLIIWLDNRISGWNSVTAQWDWNPYAYDLNSGNEYFVTGRPGLKSSTTVGDGRVVWVDGNSDIFDAELNRTFKLLALSDATVSPGETLTFTVAVSDPANTPASILATQGNNAAIESLGMSFIDHRDGTGTFSWTPSLSQPGNYNVRFTANDGQTTVAKTITITVEDLPLEILEFDTVPSEAPLSPNGDGRRDTVEMVGEFNQPAAWWAIAIINSQNNLVRAFSGSGQNVQVIWNGLDNYGNLVPDGDYVAHIFAGLVQGEQVTNSLIILVDTVAPNLSNLDPSNTCITCSSCTTNNTIRSFMATASDNYGLDHSTLSLDDGVVQYQEIGGVSGLISYTPAVPLSYGCHKYTVSIEDGAGNVSTTTVMFTVVAYGGPGGDVRRPKSYSATEAKINQIR